MKLVLLAVFGVQAALAAIPIRLVTSVPSPQPVGTVVGLTPRIDAAPPAVYTYRYMVGAPDGAFRVIRDFSQEPSFAWTPALYEHEWRIRVTVRNNATKETSDAEAPFQIVSRVPDSSAVVTPTAHPLMALFSLARLSRGNSVSSGISKTRRGSLDAHAIRALPRCAKQQRVCGWDAS